MAIPIDLGLASQKYGQNTPASAPFWAQKATQQASVWESKAKSTEAEQNYAAGVQFAAQNQLRLKGLAGVTAQDYASGVQGAQNIFQQKTAGAGGKWATKFQPYAREIERIVPTLPAKVPGQARQNTINRSAPIAEALQQAKIRGVTGFAPTTAGIGGGTAPTGLRFGGG